MFWQTRALMTRIQRQLRSWCLFRFHVVVDVFVVDNVVTTHYIQFRSVELQIIFDRIFFGWFLQKLKLLPSPNDFFSLLSIEMYFGWNKKPILRTLRISISKEIISCVLIRRHLYFFFMCLGPVPISSRQLPDFERRKINRFFIQKLFIYFHMHDWADSESEKWSECVPRYARFQYHDYYSSFLVVLELDFCWNDVNLFYTKRERHFSVQKPNGNWWIRIGVYLMLKVNLRFRSTVCALESMYLYTQWW